MVARNGALPDVQLIADGLQLRPFTMGDIELIEEAATDSFIPLITTVPSGFTAQEGEAFIQRQLGRRESGEGWSLAIHDDGSDRAVGQIGLWMGNAHKGRAEIGYWVVASARGSGFAARATDLLSDWALRTLDITRLSLFIEPWNVASVRTAEAAGYRCEGLLERWERVDGVAKDMYSFVRLDPNGPASSDDPIAFTAR